MWDRLVLCCLDTTCLNQSISIAYTVLACVLGKLRWEAWPDILKAQHRVYGSFFRDYAAPNDSKASVINVTQRTETPQANPESPAYALEPLLQQG